VRTGRDQQSLSYPLRLPDEVQADALRLLEVSRQVINATVAALWPQLDEFGKRDTKYAYKQVTAMIGSSHPHGDRHGDVKQSKRVASYVDKLSVKSGLP
jgi:putative transposase